MPLAYIAHESERKLLFGFKRYKSVAISRAERQSRAYLTPRVFRSGRVEGERRLISDYFSPRARAPDLSERRAHLARVGRSFSPFFFFFCFVAL